MSTYLPDGLPSGEGTWVRVYTPNGIRWERVDEHGATRAVHPDIPAKDVPVYDPDSGDYYGDVRVCSACGQVACLNGDPCGPRRGGTWPPPEERR